MVISFMRPPEPVTARVETGDELIAAKMIISASSPAPQRKGVAAQGKGLADPFLLFIRQKSPGPSSSFGWRYSDHPC